MVKTKRYCVICENEMFNMRPNAMYCKVCNRSNSNWTRYLKNLKRIADSRKSG